MNMNQSCGMAWMTAYGMGGSFGISLLKYRAGWKPRVLSRTLCFEQRVYIVDHTSVNERTMVLGQSKGIISTWAWAPSIQGPAVKLQYSCERTHWCSHCPVVAVFHCKVESCPKSWSRQSTSKKKKVFISSSHRYNLLKFGVIVPVWEVKWLMHCQCLPYTMQHCIGSLSCAVSAPASSLRH